MIKYLANTANRLKSIQSGMTADAAAWEDQTETPATLQVKIDALIAKEKEIEALKEQLAIKQAEAHRLSGDCEDYADRVEALVVGVVGKSIENLTAYGIELRKTGAKKPAPSKKLLLTLKDDTDGIGFIVSVEPDSNADHYEWLKGMSDDPTKTDVIPELKFFQITTKAMFVDDDVPKGVRVFYRVRAINNSGQGPWSEAGSRVQ
jgi:hypothetical protein